MKNNYSFLKDELALMEIRKHKWIESEKNGCEVGFATSALEWINQYGPQWLQFRSRLSKTEDLFSEKRHHRRFYQQLPVQLKVANKQIGAQTYDINLIGLSCTTSELVQPNTITDVTLHIPQGKNILKDFLVRFQSRVTRIIELKKAGHFSYNIFLPFNEETRNYLRANPELLGQA